MNRRPRTARLLARAVGVALLLLTATACAPKPMMHPTVARDATAGAHPPRGPVQRCVGTLCFSYDEPATVAQR